MSMSVGRIAMREDLISTYEEWRGILEEGGDDATERFAVEKLKHAAAALEEALIELDREEARQ